MNELRESIEIEAAALLAASDPCGHLVVRYVNDPYGRSLDAPAGPVVCGECGGSPYLINVVYTNEWGSND